MRTTLGVIGANGNAIEGVTVEAVTTMQETNVMGIRAKHHKVDINKIDEVVLNTALNENKRRFAGQGATETRYFPV